MFAHSKSALMALFATLIFSSMGFAQVEDFTSKLKSPDAATRKGAAYSLGRMGPTARAAVPELITALKDTDQNVRRSVAIALGNMGPAARAAIPAPVSYTHLTLPTN